MDIFQVDLEPETKKPRHSFGILYASGDDRTIDADWVQMPSGKQKHINFYNESADGEPVLILAVKASHVDAIKLSVPRAPETVAPFGLGV